MARFFPETDTVRVVRSTTVEVEYRFVTKYFNMIKNSYV